MRVAIHASGSDAPETDAAETISSAPPRISPPRSTAIGSDQPSAMKAR